MIYMRQPNFTKALAETNSLIADEPNNPYFYEVRGQIYMSMAKPALAIPDYQKAVRLKARARRSCGWRWRPPSSPPRTPRWPRRRCRI